MVRRVCLVAGLVAMCAHCALAADSVRLSAKRISTWTEGSVRVFVLEGAAMVTGPGGNLAADAAVVRFDEKDALRTKAVRLRVYSETGGVGSVTTVSGPGELAVDDSSLKSYSSPQESDLTARAKGAFEAQPDTPQLRSQELPTESETPAPAKPGAPNEAASIKGAATPAALEQKPPEAAAAPNAPVLTGQQGGETVPPKEEKKGKSTTPNLLGGANLPMGDNVITYSPIDSDFYDSEIERIGNTTRIVITGGIEIALGEYKMRAGNMVIYAIESEDGKVKEVQIYAEDNVKFITAAATLDADRMFYDSTGNSALLVDARLYTELTEQGLPLILRADKVRSYAGQLYRSTAGYATTCEFGHPHYRLAAESTSIIPLKHPDGTDSALVVSRGNEFYVGNIPILRWPKMSRDIKEVYSPLRRLSISRSDNFGDSVYTTWNLFDFFGGETAGSFAAQASQWSELLGDLDYRSKRGVGTGLEFRYTKPEIKGAAEVYYIRDRGTDGNGFVPPSEDRGRVKWQQRAFYSGYQIDTELSYISDRGFLPEYFERESKEDKAPETYLYVKRPWEHAQGEFLYRAKLNDFQTQTEYLPQGRMDFAGYPLWDGRILYNATTTADNVRFNPDHALHERAYQAQRFDTKHEFEAPFGSDLGLTLTPFTTIRESYWDDDARGDRSDRFAGSWGAKFGAPPVWRVYDVSSRMLNINRLRHIVSFDLTYEDVYDSTRRPTDLLSFDDIETVRRQKTATLALRQRLQTKRDPIVAGDPRRVVDFITLDAEADYFPEARRDNAGKSWSDVRLDSRTALTDDVWVILDGDYDTYQDRFDKAGAWLRVDHSPRTTFGIGHRNIRTVSSSVLTASVDHVITDRWEMSLVSQYDFEHGHMLDDRIVLRRKVHEFAVEFKVKYDRGRRDTTFGIDVYLLGIGGIRRF